MPDWSHLDEYLKRSNYHYERVIEDPSEIQTVDESVTKSLTYLREIGLDTADPEVMYAFITGISIAYRHGLETVREKCGNPMCAHAYCLHHGQSHGDLALVTRTLARNLGVEFSRYEDDEDDDE